MKKEKPIYWIFLCQDYLKFLKWKDTLGNEFTQISFSSSLQEVASNLRTPFLDLITELGARYNSPAWWASRISERNTMISHLFLYCCYLRIIRDLVPTISGTLCIICESWAVLESIAEVARQSGSCIIGAHSKGPFSRVISLWTRVILRTCGIIRRGIQAKVMNYGLYLPKNKASRVLLQTHIEESCFGEDGVFHDRYFPGLREWLDRNGFEVVTIPVFSNVTRGYRLAWKWLSKNPQKFINPYKYYRISDYFFALRESFRQLHMPDGKIILQGIDVTELFREERICKAFECSDSLLYYYLPKRLTEANLIVDILIIAYENMVREKLLNLGFRQFMPSSKIVGFQHTGLFPLMLCLFVTRGESAFAPLPDKVVCNGEYFREILIREGLPKRSAVVGPALRYAYLWKDAENVLEEKNDTIDILVPLPLPISEGIELLIKIIKAFQTMENLHVVLKPHPLSSIDYLLRSAGIRNLPEHFDCSNANLATLFPRAKVVIGMSSNSIIEGLAGGIPVIPVGRECSLNLNPLGFFPEFNRLFHSPEEIRDEAFRLLSLTVEQQTRYKEKGNEILRKCFNKVDETSMRAFVEGIL